MTYYLPSDPNVEVSGRLVQAFIDSVDFAREARKSLFQAHGTLNVAPEDWYDWTGVLFALRDIERLIGERMLFMIGEGVGSAVELPEPPTTLPEILAAPEQILDAYHRGGSAGSYRVLELDATHRTAVIALEMPYPTSGVLGFLSSFFRRYPDLRKLRLELRKETPTKQTLRVFDLHW